MNITKKYAETGLKGLFFSSIASHLMTDVEISSLLKSAHARNLAEGITGVLFYNDGCFTHYLEGSCNGVSKVYEIINADPLHYEIIELFYEDILIREFPHWPIGFYSSKKTLFSESKLYNDQLDQWLEQTAYTIPRTFIRKLWRDGQSCTG